jgi:hypothetical protein
MGTMTCGDPGELGQEKGVIAGLGPPGAGQVADRGSKWGSLERRYESNGVCMSNRGQDSLANRLVVRLALTGVSLVAIALALVTPRPALFSLGSANISVRIVPLVAALVAILAVAGLVFWARRR